MTDGNSRSARWLILCGIGLFLLGRIQPVRHMIVPYRTMVEQTLLKVTTTINQLGSVTADTLLGSSMLPRKIERLEQQNRSLYDRLATAEQSLKILQATASATISGRKKDPTTPAYLSYARGSWIALLEKQQGVMTKDAVLLDGIYVGAIEAVYPHASTIAMLADSTEQFVVVHARSGKRGVFSRTNTTYTLQFLEKIDTLNIGDFITTIPDGTHTTVAYPFAEIATIISDPAGTGSQVTVRLLAHPTIGLPVEITQVHER